MCEENLDEIFFCNNKTTRNGKKNNESIRRGIMRRKIKKKKPPFDKRHVKNLVQCHLEIHFHETKIYLVILCKRYVMSKS